MRGPRAPGHDRWLTVRIGMAFAAAVFLLLSMARDDRRYAIPAIVIAVAALAMRWLPSGSDGVDADDSDDEVGGTVED
ncbi:MAG TPA: hypothetical protein VFH27_11745 [Longimicrobiaceae bacterium]|nr:hypothetical protein [Longimicrobiaceae bacterium]